MIIGKGNIEKALYGLDCDDLVFFASGVSDSSCKDQSQFNRELDLLMSIDKNNHIVYFSNLGVYRWDSDYIRHKIFMENKVREYFNYYTIVRVEVLRWGTNHNTIHNFFKRMIEENKPITIQNTYRYVLDLEEFREWISYIKPFTKGEMNIMGKKMHVIDIYKEVIEGKI